MEQSKTVRTVLAARDVSVPIIAIQTPDQHRLIRELAEGIGSVVEVNGRNSQVAKMSWDRVNGLRGLNDFAKALLAKRGDVREATQYPEECLRMVTSPEWLPEYGVLFMLNAHRFLEDAPVSTGVLATRELYKTTMRTLILLGPSFRLPSELQHDVIVLDQPMPSLEELGEIVKATYGAAKESAPTLPDMTEEGLAAAVNAVRGLAPFDSEQVVSMAMRDTGLDLKDVWDRKRAAINQTLGLTLEDSATLTSWDDLGGHARLRDFSERLRDGQEPPIVVLMLDEIEKMTAGASRAGGYGDTSGVSDDQKGVLLREMQDNGWTGILCVGPPGTGKTEVGKALARSVGAEFIKGDFGSMKGSLVGQSEQLVRDGFRVVKSIGGSRVLVFATANALDNVTPDMRRRFRLGRWYFDLPNGAEKDAIWTIHLTKHGLDAKKLWSERPDDTDWTGAEIFNCCNTAWRLGISLKEAATYIVPVAKEMPETVDKLRELADGRFLSTSYPGMFEKAKSVQLSEGVRRFAAPRLLGVAVFEQGGEQVPAAPTPADKKKAN